MRETFVGKTGHVDNEFDLAGSETWTSQVSEVIFVFTVDHGSHNDVHLFSMSLLRR